MSSHSHAARIDALLAGQFAADDQLCYLNHAAIAPWPRRASDAVKAFAEENFRQGPANYRDWIQRENRLRHDLARLLNAPSVADIALLKNTTEGICTVAFGTAWQPGDNIVLPLDEFPSNRLPWQAQAGRGVEIRQVDIRAAENAEAALLDAMDDRTRLLAVSAVQWADGFRLDLARLGTTCREREVRFFVDAIQQLGALQLDVSAASIDYLAADAHKWLLGPEGVAVFFSTAPARSELQPVQLGWHALANHWSFGDDTALTHSARRFEAGSPNSLGQVAMLASLGLLLDIGMAEVEQRILANTASLMAGLEDIRGVEITSRRETARQSGIVSFRHATRPVKELHDALQTQGLQCSLRNHVIRLSPHCYQDAVVMHRVLEQIEQACA